MLFTKAKLSIEPAVQKWIDDQTAWLIEQLSMPALADIDIIEPIPEHFPDPWDGSPDAGIKLFGRVCKYAGVNPERVELGYMQPQPGKPPPALVEQGEKILLPFEVSELRNPTVAIAIMARKLALLRLLDADVDPVRDDLPLLSDLACVLTGFGIFNANASVPELPR